MGLLDNNKVIITDSETSLPVHIKQESVNGLLNLASFADYDIKQYKMNTGTNWIRFLAINQDVTIKANNVTVYISTSGVDGEYAEVPINSINFPNLIEGSNFEKAVIVKYTRKTTATSSNIYNGKEWRVCLFTDKGQIYHNYPSRENGYDGSSLDGDILKFDESVVWDLPSRKYPVKTTEGIDATLINTGVYRYVPCLPDSMYEMHPGINVETGYGNGGFDATITYTDVDGISKTRPRFWYPIRDKAQANSFTWLSGCIQDEQITMFGTYLSDTDYLPRLCVFASNNGREWFVQWECGADGRIIAKRDNSYYSLTAPMIHFSEFDDANLRIKFGNNTMNDSTAFTVRNRMQWVPNDEDKEPELIHKFMYGNSVVISSIVSDETNGIIVTTASNHGFSDGENIVINKANGNSDWNWIATENETEMSSGNGVLWKIKKLTDTTFRLMLELKNPDENLPIRHIHSINRSKDGFAISCGEEYPRGWVLYIYVRNADSYSNCFAGNAYPIYRLTSTKGAIQRLLGFELTEGINNTWYAGLDTCVLERNAVNVPEGRTLSFYRNSTGIFKGELVDIDDFNKAECILETSQPCYFFKEINGIMIFVGMHGLLALSKDRGKTWFKYQLPSNLYSRCWLLGVDTAKRIFLNYYSGGDCLVICPKV